MGGSFKLYFGFVIPTYVINAKIGEDRIMIFSYGRCGNSVTSNEGEDCISNLEKHHLEKNISMTLTDLIEKKKQTNKQLHIFLAELFLACIL